MRPPSGGCQRSCRSGFSLIELLVTTVFVMLISQLIQGSFMRSADMFGRYSHTLQLMLWSNEEMAKQREAILHQEWSPDSADMELNVDGRSLSCTTSGSYGTGPNLYVLRASANWSESGKPFTYTKEQYVYQRDISQAL